MVAPLEWVPFSEDPLGNLGMLLIPSLILGTASAAATMRLTRTMTLEVLGRITSAPPGPRGSRERVVVIRHTIKECFHSGYHPDRPAVADPGRGRCDHGEHLQPAGVRSSLGGCPPKPRLPGDLRSQPVFRRRGDGDQSPHRPDLSLFGPEGEV